MKAASIFIISFLLIIFSNVAAQYPAKVIRVVDADTYKLLREGKVITARLVNVDAPELSQRFGKEAKQKVTEILLNNSVIVDSIGTDRYNRELVSIRIDGKALDSFLINNGWAWLYLEYCKDASLAKLQRDAIIEHKGLWECGSKGACPPWLFRHYNYRNKLKYCNSCKA